MSKSALVTLTTAGSDTGPYFDIYIDADCYTNPVALDVSKDVLFEGSGYALNDIPDTVQRIRVKSKGTCINFVDITITA